MADALVSPAFESVLAGHGPNAKHDAIVVFHPAKETTPRLRGRLRELNQRLRFIEEQATEQQAFQQSALESYRKAGNKQVPGRKSLVVSPIGTKALPVASVEVTANTLGTLAAQERVAAILPNQPVHLIRPQRVELATPSSTSPAEAGCTWGLEYLGIPALWPTTKGADINVAVLDTGVHGDHPALLGRVRDFAVIDPQGRHITASPSFDVGSHGTHVCGTVAGGTATMGKSDVAIGVAPAANLLVGGVLLGRGGTLRSLLQGMSWAVEQGADIISMSLGFTYYEPLFAEVFAILIDQYGVLPIVAIGNENHGNSSSPGNAYNALSVGAIAKEGDGPADIASFSSGASLVFPGEEPHALVSKPDVAAPGANVLSAVPPQQAPEGVVEYAYMDGTSMATPHVAGVAALLMAAKPDAPATAIAQALKDTAQHPAGADRRPDNRWGFGAVRPAAALAALG